MNETMVSIFAALTGILLGLLFFGGLWWTVWKGSSSKRPALWFLGSFILRMGIALAGFYLFSDHWNRLLFCLGGFVVARGFTIRCLTTALEKRIKLRNQNHAS